MRRRFVATPWAPALLHLAIAVWQQMRWRLEGVRLGTGEWDTFWQTVDSRDLASRFWDALWHLHAQPPLFQVWGWAWYHLGGPDRFVSDMLWSYAAMGSLMTAIVWVLVHALTQSRAWATAAGFLAAVDPGRILFENFFLYDLPVAFLLAVSAWALWKATAERRARYAVVFLAAVAVATLTRSAYHLLFLVAALPFAWPALRGLRIRWRALVLVLAVLPTLGWYTKYLAQYDFFGSSSWFGVGLYKCILEGNRYQGRTLRPEYEAGLIPQMVYDLLPYNTPIEKYAIYGFDRQASTPSLARNNLHNGNIPAISREFANTAVRLIRARPALYLAAIHGSYCRFSSPVSAYDLLSLPKTYRPLPWQWPVALYAEGAAFARELEVHTHRNVGSYHYFVFPLLLLYAARRCWRGRRAPWNGFASRSGAAGEAPAAAPQPAGGRQQIEVRGGEEAGFESGQREARLRRAVREFLASTN